MKRIQRRPRRQRASSSRRRQGTSSGWGARSRRRTSIRQMLPATHPWCWRPKVDRWPRCAAWSPRARMLDWDGANSDQLEYICQW